MAASLAQVYVDLFLNHDPQAAAGDIVATILTLLGVRVALVAWRIAGDLAGLIGPAVEFLREGDFGVPFGMYALRLGLKGLKENADNLGHRFGVGELVVGVFALVGNGEPKRPCP